MLGITTLCNGSPIAGSNTQVKADVNNKKPYSTYQQKNSRANNLSLSFLSKEYEFIFFYESGCGYCIDFAPILKKYADAAGIKVIAFALGGENKAQPLFVNSTAVDQNTVAQFFGQGVKISTPTLFIWNKRNGHVYPVARGMHTYEELDFRMNELAPKILKKELEYR